MLPWSLDNKCQSTKATGSTRAQPWPNVQHFLTNFFRGVFGRAQRYVNWLYCIGLHCVAFCCLSCIHCAVLCCVVICLLFVSLVCWLKILSFPVPSLHDSTQLLEGRTTVQSAQPI